MVNGAVDRLVDEVVGTGKDELVKWFVNDVMGDVADGAIDVAVCAFIVELSYWETIIVFGPSTDEGAGRVTDLVLLRTTELVDNIDPSVVGLTV